jgi:hypothetical protein
MLGMLDMLDMLDMLGRGGERMLIDRQPTGAH